MSEKRNSLQSLALRCAAVFATGILAVASRATAEVPQQINHQGVVSVNGERFDGPGAFRFAIIDPGDDNDPSEVLWSNDGSITGAIGGIPTAAVSLTVTNGVYSVSLGDTNDRDMPNMTEVIAPSVFAGNNAVLRIWFNDGENGNQQLAPDHKLTTLPYAFRLPNLTTGSSTRSIGVGVPFDLPAGNLNTHIWLKDVDSSEIWGLKAGNDGRFHVQQKGVADHFTITPQGTVGIGRERAPEGKLHVSDPVSPQIVFDDQATRTWGIGVSATQFVIIDVNTGATHFKIDTSGVVSGTHGVYHPPSDGRLKKDVVTIPNALARVLRLRGINFKWKDSHIKGDSLRIGMIAQEVEKVFPESVHTADDGMKTKAVEYPFLVAALVEAIKELDGIVKQKDAELGAQRRRIGTVESRLAALEARLQKVGQADRRD